MSSNNDIAIIVQTRTEPDSYLYSCTSFKNSSLGKIRHYFHLSGLNVISITRCKIIMSPEMRDGVDKPGRTDGLWVVMVMVVVA
jgi:hypothetical protein